MLSSTHWGSDPGIMAILYKSGIRSKLDYSSILYGLARNIQLQKLEKFQNKCIRLIIRVFNSIAIPAIWAQTGIMPLQFHRNYLTDRFIAFNFTWFHPSLSTKTSSTYFPNGGLLLSSSLQKIQNHIPHKTVIPPLLCTNREALLFRKPPSIYF